MKIEAQLTEFGEDTNYSEMANEMINSRAKDKIDLTENQEKVIRDKYLRSDPSAEYWLDGVALNVALGEIMHIPGKLEMALSGVDYKLTEVDAGDGKKTRLILLHQNKPKLDERRINFKRFMTNLYKMAKDDPECAEAVMKAREKFYNLMSKWQFLPNSPTLMNAGRDLQQLSACYVLPIEDSIEGWMETSKNAAIIHKSGGGTGFSVCRVRPKGDAVHSTKGVASGALSPLMIIDSMTQQVKQGGTRRGANMGIMPYNHPDILDFISFKKDESKLQNFNISVAITQEFMDKVRNKEDYDLVNPKDGKVTGKLNAGEMWDMLVRGAWETGDPGLIMIDRINETNSNPTPHIGQIESTNPCGEQPLLPYEPCNLGSINLSKFVSEDGMDFDWDSLKECVHSCIHFLDNVIEVNNYPLPEIEEISKGNRRIGLGVMGWGEALVKLKLPYGSEGSFEMAEKIMKFIDDESKNKSEDLANTRGVFPFFKGSIYDKDSEYFRGEDRRLRNCARTTIAPTGTIGITAGLQGAGIEPFFAVAYVRYNAAALDALKENREPNPKDCFFEVNPLFEEIAEKNNFFGMEREELYKKIDANHKSLVGIDEIPTEIQDLFLTSHDLKPKDHVLMQTAFQKYTDNAVSKTINFKNSATIEDVNEAYWLAFDNGCKGMTIYRDGSKSFQVLNLDKKKEKMEERKRGYSDNEKSDYYQINTAYGPLHVHINYDEMGPIRVFANISPTGTEISGLTTALGIALSKYMENGGDPLKILKHLNSIKADRSYGFGPNRIDSIAHAFSMAIRKHLIKTGKFPMEENQSTIEQAISGEKPQKKEDKLYCSMCYSSNVGMISGCSEPTCFDCGYSKCS